MDSTHIENDMNKRRGLGFCEGVQPQWRRDKTADRAPLIPCFIRSYGQQSECRLKIRNKVSERKKPKALLSFDKPTLRQFLIFLISLAKRPFIRTVGRKLHISLSRYWALDAIRGLPVYLYYRVNLLSGPIYLKINLGKLFSRYSNIGHCRVIISKYMSKSVRIYRERISVDYEGSKDTRILFIPAGRERYKMSICKVPCQCYRIFFPERYTQCERVWSISYDLLGSIRRVGTPIELAGDLDNFIDYAISIDKLHVLTNKGVYNTPTGTCTDYMTIDSMRRPFMEKYHHVLQVPSDLRWDFVVYHRRAFEPQLLKCPIISGLTRDKPLFAQLRNYAMREFEERWLM